MKPVRVEFRADERWRWVWGTAAATALLFGAFAVWFARAHALEVADLEQRSAMARAAASALRDERRMPDDPRDTSSRRAVVQLMRDWSKAFTTAESLQESGVVLRAMEMDAPSGRVRLEYEIDSLVKVAKVTEWLNEGREPPVWQFEGVQLRGGSSSQAPSGQAGFQASWIVNIEKL